jgi:nucleoside phosphorylase
VIEVSIEPRELLVGHDCELKIRFSNTGTRACTDIVFRAGLPPGFLLLDGRSRVEIPELGAGHTRVHTMTVRPDNSGSYVISSVNFSYRDHGTPVRPPEIRAGLTVLKGPPPQPIAPDLDIDVVSGALTLGEWDELRLRVRNSGPSPLHAIVLTIGGPLRIATTGRQARLPSLAEWQEAEVSYIVCPAAAGRQVPAEVAVSYTDGSGRARAQNQPIPLVVISASTPPKRGSARIQDEVLRHEIPRTGGDGVLVLTALDLEYQAVREHLTGLRERVHPQGTLFETGHLPAGRGEITIALTGEGNAGAAVLAERAMSMFGPQAMLFVGVAGALKDDIELGDVVVATRVYAYHGSKEEGDEVMTRPRAWDAPHALEQLAHRIARARSWAAHLPADVPGPPPRVHFKPIAAGEVLLASRATETAQRLRRGYNDAAAIEMEGAGVAQASQFNRSLPALIIRGISDRASGTKSTHDRAGWQPRAAGHAAAFAVALAGEIIARSAGEPGR